MNASKLTRTTVMIFFVTLYQRQALA